MRPPPTLEEWQKVYCGCHRCIDTDYYLKNSVPPNDSCLKVDEYERRMWEKSRKRFEPIVDSCFDKETTDKNWDTYKFDPIDMEEFFRKNNSNTSSKWRAFIVFGNEQYMLYHEYMSFSKNVNADDYYKKADQKYKDLTTHIDKHGHIIWYTPKKSHLLVKEETRSDDKVGRRLARRLRNDTEMNAVLSDGHDVRVKKISANQSYVIDEN